MKKTTNTTNTAMTVISTDSVMSVKNAELRGNLMTMISCKASGERAMWQFAISLANIVNGKLFVEDFKSQRKFAEYIQLSPASITQYKNAVDFGVKHPEFHVETETGDIYMISLSVAALFATIEDFDSFTVFAQSSGVDSFVDIPFAKAKKLVKEYLASIIPSEESAEESAEESTEESAEKIEFIEFEVSGTLYRVPSDILSKYIVKEDIQNENSEI